MTAVPKISSCVDCATPIIGARARCPACHDRHAAALRELSPWQSLLAWLFAVAIVACVVVVVLSAGKGCR